MGVVGYVELSATLNGYMRDPERLALVRDAARQTYEEIRNQTAEVNDEPNLFEGAFRVLAEETERCIFRGTAGDLLLVGSWQKRVGRKVRPWDESALRLLVYSLMQRKLVVGDLRCILKLEDDDYPELWVAPERRVTTPGEVRFLRTPIHGWSTPIGL